MYLKAVKGILVLSKVKLPQMYKKWHFIHILKTGIFFIGKRDYFTIIKMNLFQKYTSNSRCTMALEFEHRQYSRMLLAPVIYLVNNVHDIFHTFTTNYERISARLSQFAFPMCLTSSYAFLLIFSMTIKTESNEREGLFAYCNLFCFDYFKMSNHPTLPCAWETCISRGPFPPKLFHLGFEGRLAGYNHRVDKCYIDLSIHLPRSGSCVSGCQPMVSLSLGGHCLCLETFLVVTLGGWEGYWHLVVEARHTGKHPTCTG